MLSYKGPHNRSDQQALKAAHCCKQNIENPYRPPNSEDPYRPPNSENPHRPPNSENRYRQHLSQIAKMACYEPIASIPMQKEGFNFTIVERGLIRKKSQPVERVEEERVEKEKKVLLPKIAKRNLSEHYPTHSSDCPDRMLTVDTRQSTDLHCAPNSQTHAISNSRRILNSRASSGSNKKASRYGLRAPVSEALTSEDESEDEYSGNSTPGPGYYSVQARDDYLCRSKISSFSFGSRASRFKDASPEQSRIPAIETKPINEKKMAAYRKKIVPFLSGALKNPPAIKGGPGPQDYHLRQGIEEELIRKIQRNLKGNFGVCEARFGSIGSQASLGPGSYDIARGQDMGGGSHFFLSSKARM